MNLRSLALASAVSFVCVPSCIGQITLPKILSSHMVVERDLPVHVWGSALPAEGIEVKFRGETRATAADQLGRWSVYLAPGKSGGPFDMQIRASQAQPSSSTQSQVSASGAAQTITLSDVLVGDLWVASGQSNMEFEMRKASTADQDLPHAANPEIRLLIVKKKTSEYPLEDVDTDGWAGSTPESAREFSAVAWYFAREINQKEHVPIGVIDSTWGGTVAEAWTRTAALGADAALAPLFVSWGKMTEKEEEALREDKREKQLEDEAKAAGQPEPQFPWHPQMLSWGPGLLWNGMIAPLTPMAIRGVIWYQGESNSALVRAPLYRRVFSTLIEDWRHEWGIGDFPFLYVQISNYKSSPAEDWAVLRNQQFKTLAVANTAMAVTIDIGNPDDVHPKNKLDVGHRLALAARALSYGEQVNYSGPAFRQATPEGAAIRVWFDHAVKGLKVSEDSATGFEVAGADGKFVPAIAKIDGETIVALSDAVHEPRFVRYGWANSPQCNLFNGDGLPASPFSSAE